MPYPLYPNKPGLAPLVSAAEMIAFRQRHGLAGIQPPHTVILCLYNGVMKRFWLRYSARRVRGFLGDLFIVRQRQGRVAVMGNFGIGSAVVASLADELAAWGVKRLVLLSLAGGLQPGLASGSVVVAGSALRDEGASYHYLPDLPSVEASTNLVALLVEALGQRQLAPQVGATWSTDAPYRESREEVVRYQAQGIQTVDMESAGLFAVGQARGLETASVFVVGDSLAAATWQPPSDMRPLHQRIKLVLKALIETL